MTTTRKPPKRSTKSAPAIDDEKRGASWLSWMALVVPAAALIAVIAFGGGADLGSSAAIGSQAPNFDLVSTDGTRQTLDGVLAAGNPALLYFSMGPGCDGCFAQIPEIEETLSGLGIDLVPVMVDPAPMVAAEAQRFGISSPILIDSDRSVSEAYGMLGIYGHSDRPSHSFAFVDTRGEIASIKHYAEMFVPTDQLLSDLQIQQ